MATHPQLSDLLAAANEDDVDSVDSELALEQTLADPDLQQYMLRASRDGVEYVTGYFRCRYSPGQQQHVLHVPFSPALGSVPTVEAMVTAGEQARVRVTDCQKFGIRLEVILPVPTTDEQSLLVEVIASSPA